MSEPRIITAAERAERRKKWRGLGDVVAAITNVLGVRKCRACANRQAALNKAVPFTTRNISSPTTEKPSNPQ